MFLHFAGPPARQHLVWRRSRGSPISGQASGRADRRSRRAKIVYPRDVSKDDLAVMQKITGFRSMLFVFQHGWPDRARATGLAACAPRTPFADTRMHRCSRNPRLNRRRKSVELSRTQDDFVSRSPPIGVTWAAAGCRPEGVPPNAAASPLRKSPCPGILVTRWLRYIEGGPIGGLERRAASCRGCHDRGPNA